MAVRKKPPRRRKPTRKQEHAKLLRDNRPNYERLLDAQGGGCAICHRPPKSRRLDMDHCHNKMCIRGLLCPRCNQALPSWVTPEWLRAAAEYLDHPPATELNLCA